MLCVCYLLTCSNTTGIVRDEFWSGPQFPQKRPINKIKPNPSKSNDFNFFCTTNSQVFSRSSSIRNKKVKLWYLTNNIFVNIFVYTFTLDTLEIFGNRAILKLTNFIGTKIWLTFYCILNGIYHLKGILLFPAANCDTWHEGVRAAQKEKSPLRRVDARPYASHTWQQGLPPDNWQDNQR